jgi:hypothetical protein
MAHAAVSRRPPISLDTIVARTHMYTYAAKVWDLSIVQGAFSVAPCRTFALRFATFCIAVSRRWTAGWASTCLPLPPQRGNARTARVLRVTVAPAPSCMCHSTSYRW